jgi:PTH1 family peptidyl-tRNA hydrolase
MGRMVLDAFVKKNDWEKFEFDKKFNSLVTEGKFGKNKAMLLKPETFMNKSGEAVKPLIKTKKAATPLPAGVSALISRRCFVEEFF